jgi:hypothetical protein
LPGTVIVPGDHSLVRFDRAFAPPEYPDDKQHEHNLPRQDLELLFEGDDGFYPPPPPVEVVGNPATADDSDFG